MLTVKTKINPSQINGLGLFSDEFIPKGTIIWRFNKKFDMTFSKDDVEQMSKAEKELVYHYAFLSKISGLYVYPGDNDRYMNHSATAYNIDCVEIKNEPELCGVANRDVLEGEEILVNYRHFDAHDAVSDDMYLN